MNCSPNKNQWYYETAMFGKQPFDRYLNIISLNEQIKMIQVFY